MNGKQKKLLMSFISLYLVAFFLFNWNDVSWLFNYKAVSGLLDDFFTPYPSIEASFLVNNSFYPNYGANQNSDNKTEFAYTDKENSLEIPILGIYAPIVFSQSTDKKVLAKDLNKGVIVYPGSVLPGEKGPTVILGHSSPLNWPKVRYDWVFNNLNDLKIGDSVIININRKQYIYKITQKNIIEKGQDLASISSTADKNVLILVSCWPPGKDYKRIVVQAELI